MVKRWGWDFTEGLGDRMVEDCDGHYVLYSDHSAIVAYHEAVMRELAKMVNELWNYDHSGIWDTEENIISEAIRRNEVKG